MIDKRNEWIKSFDISVGRYIGTNNKGFTASPVGVHTLTNNTMLLVEENERAACELYFVDKVRTLISVLLIAFTLKNYVN